MAQKIVAFIARSFDPADEAKIDPIIKCLDSFERLGFIAQSAERSEVESVSQKVRSLIDQSDVLVGIFTRRHPVYSLNGTWKTAFKVLSRQLTPSKWSAPPWVLQESGYALKGKKPLILFRETDVEIPGLQGDLEYIPYDPRNPGSAINRATQMITDLIAKAASITVDTVVQSQADQPEKPDSSAPQNISGPEDKPDQQPPRDEESLRTHFWDLYKAASAKDWEAARREYEAGLKWIREHKPDDELSWQCVYLRQLFNHGQTEAVQRLRELAAANKSEYLPLWYLGFCLADLREYEEAARCYLDAAAAAKPERRADLEIQAADALRNAKKREEAGEILLKLRNSDYAKEPKAQFDVLRALYSLSTDPQKKFEDFALGELALHQSPEDLKFRFTLAFDYDKAEQNHLALYHYKIICQQDENYPSALNNFGVASANSNLPVLAAKRYKRAYELGDTLAASNLGHKYLEAGLADEAVAFLKGAQIKENCVPEVSRTISTVHDKTSEENRSEDDVLAKAEEQRTFLLGFAKARLQPTATNIGGYWAFPSAVIELSPNGNELQGKNEERTSIRRDTLLGALYGETTPKTATRIETHQFSGTLSGRTCMFKLEITRKEEPASVGHLLGEPSGTKIEGYMFFSEDGYSATVIELKSGKPERYYRISKVT